MALSHELEVGHVEAFGKLTNLVNNAGTFHSGGVEAETRGRLGAHDRRPPDRRVL